MPVTDPDIGRIGDSSDSFSDISDSDTSFDTLTRGWWTFNNTLEDSYANADFVANDGVASYTPFTKYELIENTQIDKYGLRFSDTSYSATIGSLVTSGEYSANIGFWYYSPGVLGFTRHSITKHRTPFISPVIAKSNSLIADGVETITSGQGEWIVSESGFSDTQNVMQISLCNNGSGPSTVFVSRPYEPGFIHVYINIKASTGSQYTYVRIDINGDFGDQHMMSGSDAIVPINTVAGLHLNKVGYGYTAHKIFQTDAYISNLIVQQKGSVYHSKTIMMIRFGPEIALTSDSLFPGFIFFGIGYDQPTTVTTNQIFADGGSILVCRSNGEILKGYRPIWDIEHSYDNPNVLQNLTHNGDIEWTTLGVRVKNSTITI